MTDQLHVLQHTPALFVKDLIKAFQDGYCVDTSVATYPYFSNPCRAVLTKGSYDAGHKYEGDTIEITDYDNLLFVFKVQDAVAQGYQADLTSLIYRKPGVKALSMSKGKAAAKPVEKPVEKPAAKAAPSKPSKGKKALEAEATVEEVEASLEE